MADDLGAYLAEALKDPDFAREYAHASPRDSFRNEVAWYVCTWALRYVATGWFRDWLARMIRAGLAAAAGDQPPGGPCL